jgi:peptidoglycan hydrolase-like protein with peptidoglycan-binding domain
MGQRRIDVDGIYGPATARSAKKYRRNLGLSARPVVTARVWQALERGRALDHP